MNHFIGVHEKKYAVALEWYKTLKEEDQLAIVKSPRKLLVMDMYYGLNGNRVHTLLDIGKRLDVSRECVRHIKAKALRIISNWKEKNQ